MESQKTDSSGRFLTFLQERLPEGHQHPIRCLQGELTRWSKARQVHVLTRGERNNRIHYKIFLPLTGHLILSSSQQELRVEAGELGIVDRNLSHQESWVAGEDGVYAHYFIAPMKGRLSMNLLLWQKNGGKQVQTPGSLPFEGGALMEEILHMYQEEAPFPAHASKVLADVLLRGLELADLPPRSRIVSKAMRIMLDQPGNPALSVSWLAEQVNCHPDTLSRRFSAETGNTLLKTLRTLRMQIAKDMLQEGDLAISEVAQLCGYRDHSHFSRDFHRNYGSPPSQFSLR